MKIETTNTDALILIDIQGDFMAGGALEVPDAQAIIPEVESLAAQFDNIIITQDFHPAGHKSFASSHEGRDPFDVIQMPYGDQVLWPDHCVQGTPGADLNLAPWILNKAQVIIRKGFRADVDSYSALKENDKTTSTGLAGYLNDRGIKRLFMCGLATDFCVAFSALDARAAGFDTMLLTAASRGIDPAGVESQIEAMRAAGVNVV